MNTDETKKPKNMKIAPGIVLPGPVMDIINGHYENHFEQLIDLIAAIAATNSGGRKLSLFARKTDAINNPSPTRLTTADGRKKEFKKTRTSPSTVKLMEYVSAKEMCQPTNSDSGDNLVNDFLRQNGEPTPQGKAYWLGRNDERAMLIITAIEEDREKLAESLFELGMIKNAELADSKAEIDKLKEKNAEDEEEKKRLRTLATIDELTGLLNRRGGTEALQKLCARIKRNNADSTKEKQGFAFLMLDIDFFKHTNDTYGHPVGDQVLKKLADILRTELREEDVAYRYGGEEFTIGIACRSREEAGSVAEKMRKAIEKRCRIDDVKISNTVSIGVSFHGEEEFTMEFKAEHIAEFLEYAKLLADRALYNAKGAGRNCFRFPEFSGGNLTRHHPQDKPKPA